MANLERETEISVLCIPGVDMKLEDNFFINGRGREWLDPSIINYVDNNSSSDGVYALSTDMEADGSPDVAAVSAIKALKRFKERSYYESMDSGKKNNILKNELLDVFKYITEKNFSDTGREQLTDEKTISSPSAACVNIENGQVTFTSIGKAKIFRYNKGYIETFQYRQDHGFSLEQISVMSPEGAKGIKAEEEFPVCQSAEKEIKENDIFILCTGASSEYIDQEEVRTVLSSNGDMASMCGDILKPALMNEEERDLSVMMIKCGKVKSGSTDETLTRFEDDYDVEKNIKVSSVLAIVFACITCLLIGTLVGRALSGGSAKPASSESGNQAKATEKVIRYTTAPAATGNGQTSPNPDSTSLPTQTADTSGVTYYTIKSEDTLGKIAKQFYNDENKWEKIQKANPGLSPTALTVGKKIKIPQ